MRVAVRAASCTASRAILSRRQSGSSAVTVSTPQQQQRASRRLLVPLNRRRFVLMAASAAARDAVPAPQAPSSYVVTVHAADDTTLSTARYLLGSTTELSAGGGATAAVEFFDDEKAPSSSSPSPSTFDPALYFAALRTRSLGRCLLLSPLLPSTQDLVQKASSGAEAAKRDGSDGRALPDGAVCVADAQASGRGRGANSWASPPGCLMFSLSADVRVPGTRLPFVQYLVSLALLRAARKEVVVAAEKGRSGGGSGDGGIEDRGATATTAAMAAAESIRIKWPNDLYAGGKKLAGVLCHSSYVSSSTSASAASAASAGGGGRNSNSADVAASCFRLTAGVGINVTNDPPQGAASLAGLLQPLAEKEGSAPSPPPPPPPALSREKLLASTLSELEPVLDALASPAGFSDELRRAYERAWLHSGQVVEVEEGVEMLSSSPSGAAGAGGGAGPGPGAARPRAPSSCRVTITGLSPSGFLAAVGDDGEGGVATLYELHPDGNSLDFFKGLVKRKAGPPPPP